MSYSKQTNFYRLPVMAYGDYLTEEDEMNQLTIIDNLLYAATFGASKCIIEEGNYQLIEENNRVKVKITPSSEFSLLGILNYRLFLSKNVIETPFMPNHGTWYVFAIYTPSLETDSTCFSLDIRGNFPMDDDGSLYLCKIDCNKSKPELITDVDKVYGKNILAHTQDKTNPHGKLLVQDAIRVQNALSVQNNPIYGAIYDSIISDGNKEVVYTVSSGEPIFVNAYPESLACGNISWKINGNQIVFNNSGTPGIKINIKVEIK